MCDLDWNEDFERWKGLYPGVVSRTLWSGLVDVPDRLAFLPFLLPYRLNKDLG
jgi:hypothetical protein